MDEQTTNPKPGHVVWHSSDEDSGPDVGIEIHLGGGHSLWLGEISRRLHKEHGLPGDDGGWWIIHYSGGNLVAPIARVVDDEAARDLIDLLAGALTAAPREEGGK